MTFGLLPWRGVFSPKWGSGGPFWGLNQYGTHGRHPPCVSLVPGLRLLPSPLFSQTQLRANAFLAVLSLVTCLPLCK